MIYSNDFKQMVNDATLRDARLHQQVKFKVRECSKPFHIGGIKNKTF